MRQERMHAPDSVESLALKILSALVWWVVRNNVWHRTSRSAQSYLPVRWLQIKRPKQNVAAASNIVVAFPHCSDQIHSMQSRRFRCPSRLLVHCRLAEVAHRTKLVLLLDLESSGDGGCDRYLTRGKWPFTAHLIQCLLLDWHVHLIVAGEANGRHYWSPHHGWHRPQSLSLRRGGTLFCGSMPVTGPSPTNPAPNVALPPPVDPDILQAL